MAGSAGVAWKGGASPNDMSRRVEEYGKRLINAVYALASEWASRLAAEAKATHPWQNRTGDAEAKLFGRVVRIATGAVLILGHGAAHGIWLERKHGGRWGIVAKVLQRNYAAIMASLQALVR